MRFRRKDTTNELERNIQMYLKERISDKELRKIHGWRLSESYFGNNVNKWL